MLSIGGKLVPDPDNTHVQRSQTIESSLRFSFLRSSPTLKTNVIDRIIQRYYRQIKFAPRTLFLASLHLERTIVNISLQLLFEDFENSIFADEQDGALHNRARDWV